MTDKFLPEISLGNHLLRLFGSVEPQVHLQDCRISRCAFDFLVPKEKILVEFDGSGHYQQSQVIRRDLLKDQVAGSLGYRVVRIPYFVQLTNDTFYEAFGFRSSVKILTSYPHGFVDPKATLPADFSSLGVEKFINDFTRFQSAQSSILETFEAQMKKHGDYRWVIGVGPLFQWFKNMKT